MQIKVKGIVLKHRNIGENDRIISVLTDEYGVIEMSARQAKSVKGGIAASCQLLCYSEFCLYKGKGGYIINSAEEIESFYKLRLDVVKLSLGAYFAELAIRLSLSEETSADFLRIFLNTLFLLQNDKMSAEALKSVFELRGMSVAGFMPNLVCCRDCSRYEADAVFFLPEDGTLICGDCLEQSPIKNDLRYITMEISQPVLSAMRHIIFSPIEKLFAFKISDAVLSQLNYVSERYVLLHTEGQYKSLEVYKSLVNEAVTSPLKG